MTQGMDSPVDALVANNERQPVQVLSLYNQIIGCKSPMSSDFDIGEIL